MPCRHQYKSMDYYKNQKTMIISKILNRIQNNKKIKETSDELKRNSNIVKSNYVSLKAINGNNINIMEGTHIDKESIINSYTYIGYNCFVTKSQIGRYTSIANNVSIGMGEHNLQSVTNSSFFYDDEYAQLTKKDCIIGHDVWIGVDSIIRRGVKIGNGAIIGANSFVNKNVPDFAIVAGSPAKIIKYRFSPEIMKKITNSEWWKFDLNEAKKIIKEININ